METWSYKRNGAVEGPVGTDELATLYEAGAITGKTLVRSTTAGGGWRCYEDVVERRRFGVGRGLPRPVKKFWPWFVIVTPIVVGMIDVFLVQSRGNELVASNAWIGHAPIIVNLAAIALWLVLIWIDNRRIDRRSSFAEMILWLVLAPVYQAFSWWAAALVSMLINLSNGYEIPRCDSDVVKAQVGAQFERIEAKKGQADVHAVALTDTHQQWGTDRAMLCTGKLVAATSQSYPVRYKIEDRGNSLFRNTMHGLYIQTVVE